MTALEMASVMMENAGVMLDTLAWIVLRTSVLEIAVITVRVTSILESAFAMKALLGNFVRLESARMIARKMESVLMEGVFAILILLGKIVEKKFAKMIAIVIQFFKFFYFN